MIEMPNPATAVAKAPLPVQLEIRRWVTASRYYRAVVQTNLFGQWEIVRAWGGRNSRLGRISIQPVDDRDEAMRLLDRYAALLA